MAVLADNFQVGVTDRASAPGGNAHEETIWLLVRVDMTVADAKAALSSIRPTVPSNKPLRLIFCGEDMDDERTLGHYNVHVGQTACLIVCRATAPLLFTKLPSGLTMTFVTKAGHNDPEVVRQLKAMGGLGGAPQFRTGIAELLSRRPELALAMGDLDEQSNDMHSQSGASGLSLGSTNLPAVPASVEQVPAERIASTYTVHCFGTARSSSGTRQPTFLVVGGVHGNEVPGMLGVEALSQYLRRGEGRLARHLLEHCRVVAVPCINRAGLLCCEKRLLEHTDPMTSWGTRCCPQPGCKLAYGDGRVWGIPPHQRGSDPPPGWQDPNRGWATNHTFVKQHVSELLDWVQPDVAFWNHDWAPTKSMLCLTCPNLPQEAYEGIEPIFKRAHPDFILAHCSDPVTGDGSENSMPLVLLHERGLQSYLLETYFMGGGESARCHFEALLFLLCRHADFTFPTAELLREVGVAADDTMPSAVAG
eukprot:CAMPEP_0204152888 /NCGR_PEP_ID=MMETSP0361-20130328/27384_1 /ASSEMBLY_ACC=CAM_ASM_000343 /TAXON_ID=268821 /ORGANISM="Scrippsiella Hangoei, Strain SHTV-5" /LENGTH=476 /DNA_ID=CAMNT_0051107917 /DNA_START=11 /DNA_END=1437 /DNA_ORIENTATION=+